MKSLYRVALLLLCGALPRAGAQDGTVVVISRTGIPIQGLSGLVQTLDLPVLNGSGTVAFRATTNVFGPNAVNEGIYLARGTSLETIVVNQTAAGTIEGVFQIFGAPRLSENGTVAFFGQNWTEEEAIYTKRPGDVIRTVAAVGQAGQNFTNLSGFAFSDTLEVALKAEKSNGTFSGLYEGTSNSFKTLAEMNQAAPGTGGTLLTFSAPAINDVGTVLFHHSNGTREGLYTSRGSTFTTIATTQTPAPGLVGNFTRFEQEPAFNDSGTVAFSAHAGARRGVYSGSGGALVAIATTERLAPGFTTNFTKFSNPSINRAGTVAFRGYMFDFAEAGIYTGTGGALRTIATVQQTAPQLGGVFTAFDDPSINGGGTVAFTGLVGETSGVYLGDGQQLIAAAYTGQSVAGSTISVLTFTGGSDDGGGSQFNDHGQVTYYAGLANGTQTIQLFTPTLHYRTAASGAWSSRANWTVSLQPAAVHDVFIDPTSTLTVTGPTLPVTVKSLTVNGLGAATASLALQKTGVLTVLEGLTVGSQGALTGSGRIVGNVTSSGSFAATAGTALTLAGTITGTSVSTTGAGTVNLDGAQNYAVLNALAGITNVRGSFSGGTGAVTANAALNFSSSQTLSSLTIGAGGLVTLTASAAAAATAAPTVVPEPGTIALLASWSLLILWRVRRVRTAR